ncbi:hypothetical protein ACFWJT_05785 [Streptomyces sp. NPDC127069]|uniref:hypothetical protein n=1 Tax=Streptomyces sp. NPDC127069 TaxID=3347128 RepID=UPI003669D3F6
MTRLVAVLLAAGLVAVWAFLAAACAGVLARMDGATYAAAVTRAAAAFAAVLTLCAVVAGVLSQLL